MDTFQTAEGGTFTQGEVLPDLEGPGVVVFAFSAPMSAVWLRTDGGDGRADPFGGTPDEDFGIPLPDGQPVRVTMLTDRVAVYLGAGVSATAWGYR